MTRRPDLFIIGAPKAGTTSLYEYLAGHPQVYMSPFKEPMYFCPDVRGWRGDQPFVYERDEGRYMKLYDGARDEMRLGEATTRYLVSHDAARLVHEFQPDAYAIAMLRNPVELLHALHNERVSQGQEPFTDFAEALAADAERAQDRLLPGDANVLGTVYRESGLFSEPLKRWFAALGRDRVHVIVFDDFSADPASELHRALAFLGVDPDYQPESFAPRNTSHRQRVWVRRAIDSRAGVFVTDDVARIVLGTSRRDRAAYRFRHSRLNRRPARRRPIPAQLRASLEAELRPDVEATSALIGRDLVSLWFGGR